LYENFIAMRLHCGHMGHMLMLARSNTPSNKKDSPSLEALAAGQNKSAARNF
jgi:hypothetical protein